MCPNVNLAGSDAVVTGEVMGDGGYGGREGGMVELVVASVDSGTGGFEGVVGIDE